MKKSLLILSLAGFFSFSFSYCCPQSCDAKVLSAFEKLKKAVGKSYGTNINTLKKIVNSYDLLTIKETNSTALLNLFLKREKIEYLETKKELFLTKKHTALREYK